MKGNVRFGGLCLALVCISVFVLIFSLQTFSPIDISLMDIKSALGMGSATTMGAMIVEQIRLPRALTAWLIGASLAVAGVLMQAMTRNPLASPGVLGVNAGASLAVALITTVWAFDSIFSSFFAALIGGCLTWSIVMLLGGALSGPAHRARLVLAGIAVSALCMSVTKLIMLLEEEKAANILAWLAGSLISADWSTLQTITLPLLACVLLSVLLAPKLNLLAIGEENAQSLGLSLNTIKWAIGLIILVIVAVCISAVGSIGFIGLLVPHLARFLIGYDHRFVVPLSALIGGSLCLTADTLSRWVAYPIETPAGAIIALIGAPSFFYLVRKK